MSDWSHAIPNLITETSDDHDATVCASQMELN
jgi:hypothetical protein